MWLVSLRLTGPSGSLGLCFKKIVKIQSLTQQFRLLGLDIRKLLKFDRFIKIVITALLLIEVAGNRLDETGPTALCNLPCAPSRNPVFVSLSPAAWLLHVFHRSADVTVLGGFVFHTRVGTRCVCVSPPGGRVCVFRAVVPPAGSAGLARTGSGTQ